MNLLGLLTYMLASTVTDCSKGSSLFKITSSSFLPDPLVKGQNATLNLAMMVPTEIQGGTAKYSLTYNFIPLTPSIENLCDTVTCPILVGPLTTTSSFPVDPSLSGKVILKIEWKDLANVDLLCVSVTMTL